MMTVLGARAAVRRGLAVFPLPAGGRVPAPGWQRLVTRDEAVLPELLADARNVGVACRALRVVALDLDVEDDGQAVLAALADRLGEPWPYTLTVATPSGGRHLYFRVPTDCTIGSSSGGRTLLGPGIDIRGPGRHSGGYLIGPGSVVDGRPYVIARDIPAAPLPAWIADRISTPHPHTPKGQPCPTR
ncbi:bifunctional DNA primase/polymerase [Streptomyces wedmorensis]